MKPLRSLSQLAVVFGLFAATLFAQSLPTITVRPVSAPVGTPNLTLVVTSSAPIINTGVYVCLADSTDDAYGYTSFATADSTNTQFTATFSSGSTDNAGSKVVFLTTDYYGCTNPNLSQPTSFLLNSPAISSVTPNHEVTNQFISNIVISGNNFVPPTVIGQGSDSYTYQSQVYYGMVRFDGSVAFLDENAISLTTTSQSGSQISAILPQQPANDTPSNCSSDNAPNGHCWAIVVANVQGEGEPQPGTFAWKPFPISGPITSVMPNVIPAGSGATTITLSGTDLIQDNVVFNGVVLPPVNSSTTSVSALVPANLLLSTGTFAVYLGAAGSPDTNSVTVNVVPPGLTSLSPTFVPAGSKAVSVLISGSNFVSGSIASLSGGSGNSTSLSTTFVNATQLNAVIPASALAAGATYLITVSNPGGASSNGLSFTVTQGFALTSIIPQTIAAGSGAVPLTLTVTGGSSSSSSGTVNIGSVQLPAVISGNTWTTTLPANLTATPGSLEVTVTDGSSTSQPLPLTIVAPSVTSLNPSTADVGSPDLAVTVTGANFVSSSQVNFNGTNLAPSAVSATALTVTVPAALLTKAGSVPVSVVNGSVNSNAVTFVIGSSESLSLKSISPNNVAVGAPNTTITLTGTNFVSGAQVLVNGTTVNTAFVTSTQLTAVVAQAFFTKAATLSVVVKNGDGALSNAVPFTVSLVPFVITSLNPASAKSGDPDTTVVITGTGFTSGAEVGVNDSTLSATFQSSTQITTVFPASLLATGGNLQVTVKNPDGTISNSVNFPVSGPSVSLTSLSPNSIGVGSPATSVVLTGAGFVSGAQVLVNGTAVSTTFGSSTQLTAAFPASSFAIPGALNVTVQNPDKAVSNAQTFTVTAPTAAVTLTGPSNTGPAQQPQVTVGVTQPYPVNLNGDLTLTFAPDPSGGVDDPAIQFTSGGRDISFTVPANTTTAPAVQVQTGTVAGVISVTLKVLAAGTDVSPNPNVVTITIPRSAPTIRSATLTRSGSTLTVTVVGFSTTRELTQAAFHFTPAASQTLANADVTVPVGPLFATWYSDPTSKQYGSLFTYTQTFNLQSGDSAAVGSVSVTLTNSLGTSTPATAN